MSKPFHFCQDLPVPSLDITETESYRSTRIFLAESNSQAASGHNQSILSISRVGGVWMPTEYQEINKKPLLCFSLLPVLPALGIIQGAEMQHSRSLPIQGLLCICGGDRIQPLTYTTVRLSGHRQDNAAASSRENESRLLLPTPIHYTPA